MASPNEKEQLEQELKYLTADTPMDSPIWPPKPGKGSMADVCKKVQGYCDSQPEPFEDTTNNPYCGGGSKAGGGGGGGGGCAIL